MARAKAVPAAEGAHAVEVEAIEPIRHDGANVDPGERFSLPAEQAAALIACGAAKAAE